MESEERSAKKRKLDDGLEEVELAAPVGDRAMDDNASNDSATKKQKLSHTPEASGDADGDLNPDLGDQIDALEGSSQSNEQFEVGVNEQEPTDQPGDTENAAAPKLSKNQLKKLRRHEKWESGREDRKVKRREKIKAKKERRREAFKNPDVPNPKVPPAIRSGKRGLDGVQVPITVIFDCDFEDLMFDNEMKSLGLQITRSYSDNRKAPYRTHLAVSSFGGKMKERFDGTLEKQYTSWTGCRFFSEDFVTVAEKAKEWMKEPGGGKIAGALKQDIDSVKPEEEGEIVYLSAESDNTLERLKPNSTYIIGGLVDKNRYKGICYKRAMDRGVKTAKLPIGDFLQMNSRKVLVTNHVLEIMLKWIEYGDWGKAFMEVLPKRKGGALKSDLDGSTAGGEDDDEAAAEDIQVDTTTTGGEQNVEAPGTSQALAQGKDAATDSTAA
ncbi:guanine-1-methyltransferase-domain-containing protein [Lophiotrema nucula]|uniref:tRNA (guanine(9)-N1)-methyltransferase n=1 Tax=Lophiotrema nucula TaxID=690887 RepID=A0A6A5ZV72_9PLEO|nr:guanine-1-methyltransferase-domain-containing protein [Lophiotrema nucula]